MEVFINMNKNKPNVISIFREEPHPHEGPDHIRPEGFRMFVSMVTQ